MLDTANGPAVIRSAFALPAPQQVAIRQARFAPSRAGVPQGQDFGMRRRVVIRLHAIARTP